MIPSTQPKHVRSDIRTLAFNQFWKNNTDELSTEMARTLHDRYSHFGLIEILPKGEFHFDKNILVGGRPLMIRHFNKLIRHLGEITEIEGNQIRVGEDRFETDILLHATGYRMNLRYLELPGTTSGSAFNGPERLTRPGHSPGLGLERGELCDLHDLRSLESSRDRVLSRSRGRSISALVNTSKWAFFLQSLFARVHLCALFLSVPQVFASILTKVRFPPVLASIDRYSHYSEKNSGLSVPSRVFSL